jgi:hypothetical protein
LGFGIRWKVDFSFIENGQLVFAEAKGKEDRDFKLKFRLWKEGRGLGPLELWKGTAARPLLVGTYYPKAPEASEEGFICEVCKQKQSTIEKE